MFALKQNRGNADGTLTTWFIKLHQIGKVNRFLF